MNPKENSRARLIPQSKRLAMRKYTESGNEEASTSSMIAMNRRPSKQKDQALADVSVRLTKRKLLHNKW